MLKTCSKYLGYNNINNWWLPTWVEFVKYQQVESMQMIESALSTAIQCMSLQ